MLIFHPCVSLMAHTHLLFQWISLSRWRQRWNNKETKISQYSIPRAHEKSPGLCCELLVFLDCLSNRSGWFLELMSMPQPLWGLCIISLFIGDFCIGVFFFGCSYVITCLICLSISLCLWVFFILLLCLFPYLLILHLYLYFSVSYSHNCILILHTCMSMNLCYLYSARL